MINQWSIVHTADYLLKKIKLTLTPQKDDIWLFLIQVFQWGLLSAFGDYLKINNLKNENQQGWNVVLIIWFLSKIV